MFKPSNKIIIVDDQESELNSISKIFYDNGIGCRALLYDQFYEKPLSDVRIAFFDIKINPSAGSNELIYSNLADALKKYISISNTPFALIFWTSNKTLIDGFKKFIQEKRYTDVPLPYLINFIDKHEFRDSPEKLEIKLKDVLNEDIINLLFDFESRSSLAASKTINKIFDIIPKDEKWGENSIFNENFEKIFSKIAKRTLGVYAKENPDKAIMEALLPVLNHSLIKDSENKTSWKGFLKSINNQTLEYPNRFNVNTLNTIFHIEKSNGKKDIRGSIIEIDKAKKDYLESFHIYNFEEWFSSIIPFKDNKIDEKEKALKNSKIIIVELSAACDYHQNNKRINKYMLGIKVPIINESHLNSKRKESSYLVGNTGFNYNNEDFQIWLNLNYVFGTKSDDERFGEVLFIFKKEIMDMIGNKYASHVSRIGITSF